MSSSLARNAVYKVILNIFNLLVPLLVGPYIAGLLDKSMYGMYNRIYTEFNLFFIIGAFGIYNYGMREISKVRDEPQKVNRIFTNLFLCGIASNLIVGFVYFIYLLNRSEGLERYVYMIMMIQLIAHMFYIEFVNEAVENYQFITKKTILIRLLYLVSIFVFVRQKDDIIPYALVICLTVFANNVCSYFYVRRKIRFDFGDIRSLPYQLTPILVTFLLTNVEMLYGQLDKLLLGAFVSDVSVTEYVLPTTLMGMVCTLPMAVISVAIPRLSNLIGDRENDAYKATLQNTLNTYMCMIIPMAFGAAVLAREIMWLYSKGVYTYTYPVLIIASLIRIVYAYQSVVSNLVMYINGLEKQLTIFLLLFGLSNLVMDIVLLALCVFTPVTALLTTGIATTLQVLVSVCYSKRKLNINLGFFSKKIRGYFLISALFIPIALAINLMQLGFIWSMAIIICICISMYGVFLIKTKDPILGLLINLLPERVKIIFRKYSKE